MNRRKIGALVLSSSLGVQILNQSPIVSALENNEINAVVHNEIKEENEEGKNIEDNNSENEENNEIKNGDYETENNILEDSSSYNSEFKEEISLDVDKAVEDGKTYPVLDVETNLEEEQDNNEKIEKNNEVKASTIISIPDVNLKEELNKALGQASNADITKGQLESIKELEINSVNIKNIDGLQYCTNAVRIYIRNIKISNINVLAKANLPVLEELSLIGCGISNIDGLATANLPSLRELNLKLNGISNIDALGNLAALEKLDLSENQISNIDGLATANLPVLKELNLTSCRISNIDGLAKVNLPALEKLDLSENKISNIDGLATANLSSLTYLKLKSCGISNIDGLATANLPALTNLNFMDNQISNIDVLGRTNLPALKSLILAINQISNIDVLATANLPSLNTLWLSYNQIKNIDGLATANLPLLWELDLSENQISNIDGLATANLPALTNLNFMDNQIKDIDALGKANLPTLNNLIAERNQISSIDALVNLTALEIVLLGENQISNIEALGKINSPTLQFIVVENQKIEDQSVEFNKNSIEIENIVINFDGSKINPSMINNGGNYNYGNNKISWSGLPEGLNRLEYEFSVFERLPNGAIVDFSGTVGKNAIVNSKSYNVNYDSQGGSLVTGETVKFDELLTEPQDPIREGYTFGGWYIDDTFTTAWNFDRDKMPSKDITLYAKWNINSYNVNFDSKGGSTVGPESVEFEGLVTKPQDPIREGYTFGGWYIDDTFATAWKFDSDKMPSKDITLYAKWNINSYNVNFDSKGGSTVGPESVEFEGLVTKPQDPIREGYTFGGWYIDDTFATAWKFDSDKMPSKDITLYAKWNINSYNVNYDSQGGSVVGPESVEFEGLVTKPQDPTREGYTFAGWYTDADCTIAWDFTTGKMPSSNMTLYAKWTINSYNVNFDSQGGSAVSPESVEFEGKINKPQDPMKEGYTFGGWYTDDTFTTMWNFDSDKMPSKDITLYAKWNINSYNVNYDSQGGSVVGPESVEFEGLVTKPQDPTREGYTFAGWYTDADCTIAWDFTTGKMPSSNMTLYAKWTINSYNVNFDSQGGSAVSPESVEFEGKINKPQDPMKEGYTFGGWYTDDTFTTMWNFDSDKMPSKDITLYAKWNINSYNVNYDSQGGSVVGPESVEFEGLVTKPQDPTREGYTFGGWYIDDTFATAWNFDSDKMPSKDITLYAKWNINSYNVNYDSQGGSVVGPESVEFEGLVTKPQDPIREGYTFGGWYIDDTFTTAWNFDSDKMPSKDITLYAKWNRNEAPVIFAEGITIKVGSEFNPLANVKAEDKEDGDITERVKVIENTVNTNKAGIYSVTYEVTDSNGLTTRKTIVVIVEDNKAIIPDKENNSNSNGNKVTITEVSNSNKDNNNDSNTNSNGNVNSEENNVKDPIKPELGQGENVNDEDCILHWILLLLSAGTLGSTIVSRQRFKKKIEELVEQKEDK